jgi:CBS domain-containing protein
MLCPNCRQDNIEGVDECNHCGAPLYGLDLPETGRKTPVLPVLDEPLDKLVHHGFMRVQVDDPAALAVRRMQAGNSNAVLVMDGERLEGIITSWDIVQKVAGQREDLNAVTCAQIMSPDPIVFHNDDSIVLAINKMSIGEFRHIPIVVSDRPVSVIDVNDVFRFLMPYLV